MKYSYEWLKEYYQTPDSPQKMAELITTLGSETEGLRSLFVDDKNIVSAKIISINPHPNADKLQLATITDGKAEVTVVCGATNIKEGQIVPYAKPGAKLGEITVTEREIRGVMSPGMLLSERELGISDDHAGIKILGDGVDLGVAITDTLSSDQVIEAEVTPNRGDLLSHFGMARDLMAKSGQHIDKPEIESKEVKAKAEDELKVEIKSDKCSLYVARIIKGVKIAESPEWIKGRLIACGVKPINNVVDITNYIMLDLGHPLHAFDAKKVEDKTIVVAEVEKEQEVMCLDDKARVLLPEMLCIYGGEKPVAIAGVMGLKCSEIDDNSTDIILEAAVFDPKSVRKTSKLLGVKTEASYRFERGVDDRGTSYAIKKAAQMISEVAGGEVLFGEVTAGGVVKQGNVPIEYDKINKLSGTAYTKNQVDGALKALGFEINEDFAYVPSWRHDISIWQDLLEEVMRLEGLDKVKPEALSVKQPSGQSDYFKKEKIKDYLVEMGLDEAITYTFLSDNDIRSAKLEPKDLLEVANPVQVENRYLRNSLVPGLLKVLSRSPSFDDIEIFEMGRVFDKSSELERLAIVTSGKSSQSVDKIVGDLCKKIGVRKSAFNVYEIKREELKRFKIKKPMVHVAEAEIPDLINGAVFDDVKIRDKFDKVAYRPISKYPPVSRDLAFVVDVKYTISEVKDIILDASQAVVLAEPFDEFRDDRFGKDKKSVAFHIYLQNMDKTMSDEEAGREITRIITNLKKVLKAEVRS